MKSRAHDRLEPDAGSSYLAHDSEARGDPPTVYVPVKYLVLVESARKTFGGSRPLLDRSTTDGKSSGGVSLPHHAPGRYSPGSSSERYMPLEENEFRILRLHPSLDPSAPLVGTLLRTGTSAYTSEQDRHDHSFRALSYVWGRTNRDKQIQCFQSQPGDERNGTGTTPQRQDGVVIPITHCLYTALQHLRKADIARNIWADGVCIDQANIEERSRQVKLMGRIFQSARDVIIWLGTHSEGEAEVAFKLMRKMSALWMIAIYRLAKFRWTRVC